MGTAGERLAIFGTEAGGRGTSPNSLTGGTRPADG
jgi:hypothetical protein